MGLLCVEQDVGNFKQWTVGNYGTPVRRTKLQKYKLMNFHKLWDSWTQNKTSELSKNARS